ncbi:HEPN domain-containing protein [Stenotrophomonas maltophilia]|uniref:HEPN domain-containing protein n=1 Tax=Stenotrophomonas maltophilia TaxID=40324 RepID=UPI004041A0C8
MASQALKIFNHVIQDAVDLLAHFDAINSQPPPDSAEVLKRASLVMALAALETYIEDRINEAAGQVVGRDGSGGRIREFYLDSLQNDLKYFHTPTPDRVGRLFEKYLQINVFEGWAWNNYDQVRAKKHLSAIAKKRGDIAHRSLRPAGGQASAHAVTREDLRKHIRFIQDLAAATDRYIEANL